MKKLRIISFLLLTTIIFGNISFVAGAEDGGLFNFKQIYNFYESHFTDVSKYDWFYPYVSFTYGYGLMQGDSRNTFNPYGEITAAEAIALASRIHSIYHKGRTEFLNASPWYRYYVEYALYNNIIPSEYSDYDIKLSREEFVSILAKALPSSEFNRINNISYGSLPDVPKTNIYADDIYMLYNAGILTGNDNYGTFEPLSSIHRCEVSTIITRMIDITLRKKNSFEPFNKPATSVPKAKLTAEEISRRCSSAVFYVDIYGFSGVPIGSGSGFFISQDGLAITNCHVVENAGYLEITTTDDKVYNDITIMDYDRAHDVALIKINGGNNFNYLKPDADFKLIQGQTVYAIGSPRGLSNTMSQGIISNVERVINDIPFIQISAQIDGGSSGGALINEYGNVIGVVSASIGDAADLNLAVPIRFGEKLDKNSEESCVVWEETYYSGFNRVLDFAVFSGMPVYNSLYIGLGYIEEYNIYSKEGLKNTLLYYTKALEQYGMNQTVYTDTKIQYDSYDERLLIDIDYEKGKITVKAVRKPEYYMGTGSLIDLGWYFNLPVKEGPVYEDGYTIYKYSLSDYSRDAAAFAQELLVYFALLEDEGFTMVENEREENTTWIDFEGNGLAVTIGVTNSNIGILIEELYYEEY